jgi:hypothetical protein
MKLNFANPATGQQKLVRQITVITTTFLTSHTGRH